MSVTDVFARLSLNGHLVGIAMKEMVRRAIVTIRRERFTFEAEAKLGYTGEMNDLVTSADKAAQQVYLRTITECFPGFGVIAEEDNLSIPCTIEGHNAYFTVDPLDGTKAFGRRQSHGVGTMIALVIDGQVVSAWVGDVTTQEIYGYRPDSTKTHRISEYEHNELLQVDPTNPLSKQNLLLRERPDKYSTFVNERLLKPGVFKDYEIGGGSIGVMLARLWKGEVGAIALARKAADTPWDETPLVGISERMGFVYLKIGPDGFERYNRPLLTEVDRSRDYEILVVHRSRLSELGIDFLP